MERRLGISVYPEHSNMEDDKAYIKWLQNTDLKEYLCACFQLQDLRKKLKNILKRL